MSSLGFVSGVFRTASERHNKVAEADLNHAEIRCMTTSCCFKFL